MFRVARYCPSFRRGSTELATSTLRVRFPVKAPLEGRCSIHLSYGVEWLRFYIKMATNDKEFKEILKFQIVLCRRSFSKVVRDWLEKI